MATVRKVLGQLVPAGLTIETLYTVPANTEAVVSSLIVSNFSGADNFLIAVVPDGESYGNEHNIYYNIEITAANSFVATVGVTMAAGDSLQVLSIQGNLTFAAFGQEIT